MSREREGALRGTDQRRKTLRRKTEAELAILQATLEKAGDRKEEVPAMITCGYCNGGYHEMCQRTAILREREIGEWHFKCDCNNDEHGPP